MFTQAGVLCKWTADSKRLILESFDAIHDSPSYTYHSAIPLSPPSSWLHQNYAARLSQQVKVVKGLEWGMCSRTVTLEDIPVSLTCWKATIAAGMGHGSIILLDVITGSQVAVFSKHAGCVRSLAFSSDGISLVSGGDDKTVRLWDVQTGGVVKIFQGHTDWVWSVSISADCTVIASGAGDEPIHLWDIQTGECCVMKQNQTADCVEFSPKDPQCLISVSGNKIQQLDINGHQIGPTYDGSHIAFSPDGTQFVSCKGTAVTIRNTNYGTIVAEFLGDSGKFECCCFSPDGKSVAVAAGSIIYIWDISGLSPHHVNTFVGHSDDVRSISFSSSLVSASNDKSVKFWQICSSSTDPATTNLISIPPASAPIRSINLQAKDGIAISTDSNGVVKSWDILTGLCRTSFQIPAKGTTSGDAQLIDKRLITVWWADQKLHVWDVEKNKLLQTMDAPGWIKSVRISGDGSQVFCINERSRCIEAWSILTGEVMDTAYYRRNGGYPMTVDGSRVWIQIPGFSLTSWNFGVPDSPCCGAPVSKPHLVSTFGAKQKSLSIKDIVTGKEVLCLPGRFAEPIDSCWDGQYLVAGYDSGEVLILDFGHVPPSKDL